MPNTGVDDTVMLTITINFDVHIIQLFPPLLVGAALVVAKPTGHTDPAYIVDIMVQHHVTAMMSTVPTLVRDYA